MTRSLNDPHPPTSLDVRAALIHALQLDLIGPDPDGEHAEESLPGWERPSVWYLTGFLVPTGTPVAEKADDEEDDDFDGEVPERAGLPEESTEHGKRTKRRFFPSSMGLSFLVRAGADAIRVTASGATTGGESTVTAPAKRFKPGYAPQGRKRWTYHLMASPLR